MRVEFIRGGEYYRISGEVKRYMAQNAYALEVRSMYDRGKEDSTVFNLLYEHPQFLSVYQI